MNFFLQLHKSITDPPFYKEVLNLPRLSIANFFFKLLMFTALLTALSQTYYLVDSERGIPKLIDAIFPDMEIKNGVLDPKTTTPYIPPSYLVLPVFNQMFGSPHIFDTDSDSILIIDTGDVIDYPIKVPVIMMKSDRIVFYFNAETSFRIPYNNLLFGQKDLLLTAEGIQGFMIKNIISIFLWCFFSNSIQSAMLLIFSTLFLAVAAFIFRVERERKISHYFRTACFAVSPISVGSVLIGISGVKIAWTWHILIFISTIVMFRAIMASATTKDSSGENV